MLAPELRRTLGQRRLRNDDGVALHGRVQWNGIAPPGLPHGLSVDGCGAVLAYQAVRSAFEAHRTADFAGVEDGGNLAVGLAIEEEAHLGAVHVGGVAVQVAISELSRR